MYQRSISAIFEMSFPRRKLINRLKMLKSLGLNMQPMVLKNKVSFTSGPPETGRTQPGKLNRLWRQPYGNSRSFQTIAFGIGTSESRACLPQCRPLWQVRQENAGRNSLVFLQRSLFQGFTFALIDCQVHCLKAIVGYVVEYHWAEAIDALTMEGRMTICNMSIEFWF